MYALPRPSSQRAPSGSASSRAAGSGAASARSAADVPSARPGAVLVDAVPAHRRPQPADLVEARDAVRLRDAVHVGEVARARAPTARPRGPARRRRRCRRAARARTSPRPTRSSAAGRNRSPSSLTTISGLLASRRSPRSNARTIGAPRARSCAPLGARSPRSRRARPRSLGDLARAVGRAVVDDHPLRGRCVWATIDSMVRARCSASSRTGVTTA